MKKFIRASKIIIVEKDSIDIHDKIVLQSGGYTVVEYKQGSMPPQFLNKRKCK